MIKIYGSPKSSAGRVYWMLEELGLKYERVPLDMRAKEHKSESFLKLNPNGKVPVLIDGHYTIFESMAINSYLADKYQSALIGATPEARGHVQQWSYWAILELQKPLIEAFIQKFFVPDERRDQAVIEKAMKSAEPLLHILDKKLSHGRYIVGDSFTMADLNVASVVSIANSIQLDLHPYKNVSSWLSHCKDRPAYLKYAALE